MFLHGIARYAVGAAGAQDVSCGELLGSAAGFERHEQICRAFFDGLYLGAVFNLDAKTVQMFAQNRFGAPLRQAALKFILGPDTRELGRRDFLQTRSEQLNLPDVHAGAKKRLDQAGPLDDLQRRRLYCGLASLVMRPEPTLHDARLDAMTNKFAGCEQSGWTAPHDQDGGSGCGLTNLAERQRHDCSSIKLNRA
jgi:hypothetical protein